VWATREHQAVGLDLLGWRVVIDDVGVDTRVPERALFQVGELPAVIDDGDASHNWVSSPLALKSPVMRFGAAVRHGATQSGD